MVAAAAYSAVVAAAVEVEIATATGLPTGGHSRGSSFDTGIIWAVGIGAPFAKNGAPIVERARCDSALPPSALIASPLNSIASRIVHQILE